MIRFPHLISLLIISLLCTSISPYLLKSNELFDLEPADNTLFASDVSSWVALGLSGAAKSSNCGGTNLLGGYNIMGRQGWFRRNYNGLPAHKSIRVSIVFWIIDGWSKEDIITLQISNGTMNSVNKRIVKLAYTEFAGTAMKCGSNIVKDLYPVYSFVLTPHTGSELMMEIYRTSLSENELASFGIRDVSILFSNSTVSTTSTISVSDPTSLIYEDRFNCPVGTNPNTGSCDNCDAACGACFDSGRGNCYFCKSNYYYDSINCLRCHSSCATCDGGLATQCLTCPPGSYMFNNNTCMSNCPAPYSSARVVQGVTYCDFPCLTTEYYYPNGTCGLFIEFPYEAKAEGLNWFADYPCNSTQFITPDRVCLNQCLPPMSTLPISGIIQCLPPCPSATPYYMEEEMICNSTCSPPYLVKNEPSYYLCYRLRDSPRFRVIDSMAVPISITLLVISAVFQGFPWAIIVMVVSRMLEYVRYLSINYAKELDQIQATWKLRWISLNLGIKAPEGIYSHGEVHEIKALYSEYGTYSLFTLNFWNPILLAAISLVSLGVFYLIELMTKHLCWNAEGYKWIKRLRTGAQNLMLVVFYSSFGNIFFFSTLQFAEPSMDTVSGTISFVLTVIFILASVLLIGLHVYYLRKQQLMRAQFSSKESKRKIQEWVDDSPGLAVLFKHFKVESVFQQGFFIFFLAREFIYMIIVRFFATYPMIQCLGIGALCLVAMIYFATSVSFHDHWDQVQVYAYESLMLVFIFAAAVVSVMDDNPTQNIGTRTLLTQVMTILFLVFPFLVLGFIVLKVVRMCLELYKDSQKKRFGGGNVKHIEHAIELNGSPNLGALSTMPLQITEMGGSMGSSPTIGGFRGISSNKSEIFNDEEMPNNGRSRRKGTISSDLFMYNENDETFNNDSSLFSIGGGHSGYGDHSQLDLLNPRKISMGETESPEKLRTGNDDLREAAQWRSRAQMRAKRRARTLNNAGASGIPLNNKSAVQLNNRPRKATKDDQSYGVYNFPVQALKVDEEKVPAWYPYIPQKK